MLGPILAKYLGARGGAPAAPATPTAAPAPAIPRRLLQQQQQQLAHAGEAVSAAGSELVSFATREYLQRHGLTEGKAPRPALPETALPQRLARGDGDILDGARIARLPKLPLSGAGVR